MADLATTKWTQTYSTVTVGARLSLTLVGEEVPDEAAPVFSAFSPIDGASITADQALTFHVEDDVELQAIFASASMDGGPTEVVYDLGGAGVGYSVTPVGNVVDGLDFTVLRDAGWYGAVNFFASAIDTSGNYQNDSVGYTAPPAPLVGDAIAPLVTNVSPAAGTPIARTQAITMDVTDETGLALVLVTATYPISDVVEVVFDGTDFTALYEDESTSTPITGGFRLTMLRDGGWPAAPTLTPYVIDTGGNPDA